MQGLPEITVVTHLDEKNERLFRRLKRKRYEDWLFLVKGEWSQSPYHHGDVMLYVAHTPDRLTWKTMTVGFGRRIVAVATLISEATTETVCAAMLQAVRDSGGDYIDLVDDYGDVDIDALWNLYRSDVSLYLTPNT